MLLRTKELEGCAVHATDGELGEVKDVYFDIDSWTLRYFVVETGSWLRHRRVLIAPDALGQPPFTAEPRELRVKLTQEQIKNSPDVDTQMPFSRQQETAYRDYYAWPVYWPMATFTAGGVGVAPPLVSAHQPTPDESAAARLARQQQDTRLRSADEIRGYSLRAPGGDVGHVRDFIFDDADWRLAYFAVDTGNWLPGKNVLIAPDWISGVNWSDSAVTTDLTTDDVKTAPEYDGKGEITPAYRQALREHYRR
ncbi:MAG: PRC-barrel domain-containing protein [Dehalococcoidia bacterium]|nr:PRC-barrel domain-containing protein [Dehalococcoidia bacterium]